jgi:2-succinyl-5-enolpyruvyl-6-hydroxy-3-cyclohexene-1-carboxylate synthase
MNAMQWAEAIIDQLIEQGVSYFCLSPGSRSSPLSLAVAKSQKAESFVHFDERGIAFHALGYAKASKRPAAVIVTSGTAVGNLLPAVMEASNDRIPMILLTADRPPELRHCGANQTTDQVKLFSNFARWQIDLPCPDPLLSEKYLKQAIGQTVYMAKRSPRGPVQINCMLREPFSSSLPGDREKSRAPFYEESLSLPTEETLQSWAKMLSLAKRGVIIVGALSSPHSHHSLFQLAKALQWPLFTDILSNMRSRGPSIAHYDLILKSLSELKSDTVLHLGDQYVSKTLSEWLVASQPSHYFSVTDHPLRYDSHHLVTHRVLSDPLLFCKAIIPYISASSSDWLSTWQGYSEQVVSSLDPLLSSLTEPSLFLSLRTHLPKKWVLFLANSMPIRDADLFFFPKEASAEIFGNRGVSGIDGNIATSVGLAQGAQRPTVALIGDQAALHDLNSLAQIEQAAWPLVLIIVNNHGGGIFSFLPFEGSRDYTEKYLAASHSLSFEKAASLFHLPYFFPKERSSFDTILSTTLEKEESCIIEIVTDRVENVRHHQQIYSAIKTCLTMEAVNGPH